MSKPQITHIVATLENGVIGTNNDLPWPMWKEDMAFFREKTTGNIVVMGYNTILSLPKRLPNRTVVGLLNGYLRGKDTDSLILERVDLAVETLGSLNEVIDSGDLPSLRNKTVYIAGGAQVYKNTINDVDIVYQNVLKPSMDLNLDGVETVSYPIELLPELFDLQSSEEVVCPNGTMVKNTWVKRQA